jgi:CcmD family protein
MSSMTSRLATSLRWIVPLGVIGALLALDASAVTAQTGGAAGVGGLRAYWHVFIAYAVVILLVLGWVVSIGRRLKDIQQRLGE